MKRISLRNNESSKSVAPFTGAGIETHIGGGIIDGTVVRCPLHGGRN